MADLLTTPAPALSEAGWDVQQGCVSAALALRKAADKIDAAGLDARRTLAGAADRAEAAERLTAALVALHDAALDIAHARRVLAETPAGEPAGEVASA